MTLSSHLVCHFSVLTTFDVICDYLLNTTWNLLTSIDMKLMNTLLTIIGGFLE